jgi:hypothetical protein
MKKNFDGKFEKLFENHLTRYQQGGILQGDIVKIREDALQNAIVAAKMENYKDVLKNAMETDLNLRVAAIKSIRPNTAENYDGYGTDAPDGYFVDLVVEYAPGLWRDPITVPIEILERINTGIEMAPIPDSLKRPDDIGDDSIGEVDQVHDRGKRTMPQDDTKQIGANKWDDKKPGAGNTPKLAKENVQLEEAYQSVCKKKLIKEGFYDEEVLNVIGPKDMKFAQAAVEGDVDLEQNQELHDRLYDYFINSGEMPYGTAKARTGDPVEWMLDELAHIFTRQEKYSDRERELHKRY